jgi:hypothetical protein
MSRGLGKRQVLFLKAIADLTGTNGDRYYRVSHIVHRAYQRSTDLQRRDAEIDADIARRRQVLKAEAANGDEQARILLALGDLIRSYPHRRGRKAERKVVGNIERDLNPSRVLAGLARRGLLSRWKGQAYALTEDGHGWIRTYGV